MPNPRAIAVVLLLLHRLHHQWLHRTEAAQERFEAEDGDGAREAEAHDKEQAQHLLKAQAGRKEEAAMSSVLSN